MNKYVVGYLSEFDGELLLKTVVAANEVEACTAYLECEHFNDMDEVQQYCANSDCFINVIRIN